MRGTHITSLFVFTILGLVLTPEVYSQDVAIDLGDKILVISKEKVQKVKELSITASPTKPSPASGKTGAGSKVNKGAQGATQTLTMNDVRRLAAQFSLTEKTVVNPHLAFGDKEISGWYEQKLNEPELRLEFTATRAILDEANKKNVPIRDQEMLSKAARSLIRIVSESNSVLVNNGVATRQERPPDVNSLICEGDTSEALIRQAWEGFNAGKGGLGAKEFEKALACTRVAIETWADKADQQQAERVKSNECKLTPKALDKDSYFSSYWALSDVAAAWFIRGRVYSIQKKWTEAREAFKVVIDKYNCANTWDPSGYFWRTAEGAERELKKLP